MGNEYFLNMHHKIQGKHFNNYNIYYDITNSFNNCQIYGKVIDFFSTYNLKLPHSNQPHFGTNNVIFWRFHKNWKSTMQIIVKLLRDFTPLKKDRGKTYSSDFSWVSSMDLMHGLDVIISGSSEREKWCHYDRAEHGKHCSSESG